MRCNKELIKEFYTKYYLDIYNYVYFRFANYNHYYTEDLVQRAFEKMIIDRPLYHGERALLKWVYTFAYNSVRNDSRLKANKEVHFEDDNWDRITGDIGTGTDYANLRIDLESNIDRFNEEEIELLRLHYDQDFNGIQIAQLMGCESHTIYNKLRKIKKKLVKLLSDE